MEIQLVSNTSFFELFLLPTQHRFTGLIPQTVICEDGKLLAWLFNSHKHPNHPILRKNKDNLSTLKFVKQLAAAIDCFDIVKECTSVGEVFSTLQGEFKKDEDMARYYANHTVTFLEKNAKIPKYIKILDFIKSLSNRTFNEPQCPQGWCLFQEVNLTRMKQHQSYFVQVYKPEGDLTFRFNYYKWVPKNEGLHESSEPPYYQIWEHKEVVKIYEHNLTQKILVTILQLISFLQTNFKLQIHRLVARYSFNRHQEAVLKGTSELRVIAPKKFVDYNKVELEQTLTLYEYLEIEKSLKCKPEMMVSVTPKLEKRSVCPGGFCSAILKAKLQGIEASTPSQLISWSVIDSHNNPQIIRNLIQIGLIEIPNYSQAKRSPKHGKGRAEGVKVCNKCFLVYKAISKIQKAETDFQSKQLQKLLHGNQQQTVKKSYNSRSSLLLLNRNPAQSIGSSLKIPRSTYNTSERLPLISNSEKKKRNPSSLTVRKNTQSESVEPIIQRYQNNKIQSPILRSIVGQRFKSKEQLKELLYKHFQKQKQKSPAAQKKQQKKEMQKHVIKERMHTEQEILGKIQELITHHEMSFEEGKKINGKRQSQSEELMNRIYTRLSHYQKIKINVDWFEAIEKMEFLYCMLNYNSQKHARHVLIIVHDAATSFLQYLTIAANIVSEETKVLLLNYPGQAYTTFGVQKLTGVLLSQLMDRFMCHLNSEKLMNVQSDSVCFCGLGYGGYLLKYYLNMNYRYYPNWNAVMLINCPGQITEQYQKFMRKFMQQCDSGKISKFQGFYKQYYNVDERLLPRCRQMNEITNEGLIYLIKSSLEQSNCPIQIKSSKLKTINKYISLNSDAQKSPSKKHTNNTVPMAYSPLYSGKQGANYALISNPKFEEVLQKFVEKNF